MPKSIITTWLLFLALVGAMMVAACGSSGEPEEVTFDLRIADRAIAGFESGLEVKQDDIVTFNITSDEPTSFHLHGYDHELELAPDVTESFAFTANAAGSFPITVHVGTGSGGEGHHETAVAKDHHELKMGTLLDMTVSVETKLDGDSAVNLKITTEGFTFAPERVNGPHMDGEGHAHVYVDGVKINRIYGPYYHLGGLTPGERSIRITLNANSHEQYARGGQPVEATTTVVIPGEAKEIADHEASASEPTEIDLGRLIVLPR